MFAGKLSRGEYARAAGIRLALFAAGVSAIPAALYVLDRTQYCPPDFCGPMAASLIIFLVMPVLYFGLMLSLLAITVCRLRDMGLTIALAAVVPLLMLGDLMAGLTLDGFVFDSYVHASAHPIPGNLVMALVCVGFLCGVRSEHEIDDEFAQRWGAAGALALAVVTIAGLLAFFKFLSEIAIMFGGITASRATAYVISYAGAMIATIILIVLLLLVAWRQRQLRSV